MIVNMCIALVLAGLAGCGAQSEPNPLNPGARSHHMFAQAASGGSTAVWWEAETPASTNFPPARQNPFAPANATEAAKLSGGLWIGVDGDRSETKFLTYEITVPKAGTYSFYSRKFWLHGPFRWRFGNQAWRTLGRGVSLLDTVDLRQFVGANWVECGDVELPAGKVTLRIELLENTGAACFDCFLLTQDFFVARGLMRPGQKYGTAPQGFFPFEPDVDPFNASAVDMRFLNEKVAGEKGRIIVRGESLVHEKTGEPFRIWAINTNTPALSMSDRKQQYFARFLAKHGVNMVRMHGGFWDNSLRKVDQEKLSGLFRFVENMKREGIYTCLSIYFPLWMTPNNDPLFPEQNGKHPFALLYFNSGFQEIYRGWWRELLTTKSPVSGLTLAEDPAVAVVEMVNEDSFFFWTFTPYENIPAPQMAILEKQYGDWLTRKYGSPSRAVQAWGSATGNVRGDNLAAGRLGFRPLWNVFSERSRRDQDQAQFLAETQKRFHQDTQDFLKKNLGYRGLTYASNWVTADPRVLGPIDKYTNTVADIMDRHGYFDPFHEGPRASYSLNAGERYADRSALKFENREAGKPPEFNLPLFDIRYNGMPSTITEINWPMPNRWRADLPLLSAAYGSLQGSDGFFFFAMGGPSWDQTLGKFAWPTPVMMAQMPATAFLYRRGLVQEGPVAMEANLTVDAILRLEGAPVSAPMSLDNMRAADIPAGRTAPVDRVETLDPLAFLVGKVAVNFGTSPKPGQISNLPRYIRRDRKVVNSATGELSWDYGLGKVTVNAPQAQGVTGFLSQMQEIETTDVVFRSTLPYGAMLVVALDGQPIAKSSRLLLQVMSEDSNFGWETDTPTGIRTIRSTGSAPVVVRNLAGSVRLKRADAESLRVSRLDLNGYPAGTAGSGAEIRLSPQTFYYLIER